MSIRSVVERQSCAPRLGNLFPAHIVEEFERGMNHDAQKERETLKTDETLCLASKKIAVLCIQASHLLVWLHPHIFPVRIVTFILEPNVEIIASQQAAAIDAAQLLGQRQEEMLAATQLIALGKSALQDKRQLRRLLTLGGKSFQKLKKERGRTLHV